MSEELTACRVAVENCEMFRARIADLEHRCGMYGLELTNEVERRLQAERQLSAIKAQEPVAWEVYYADDDSFHTITRNKMLIDGYSSMAYVIKPLYAAPVSEAKAQGVVMPEQDGSDAQIAFWAGFEFAVCGLHNGNIRAAWNDFKGSEQFKRLNAAPVQQVSVPDERAAFEREDRYVVIKRSDMARIPNQKVVHSFLGALGELSAHSVRIQQRKFLVIESDWPEYDPAWKLIQDRVQGRPILDAAQAAPAADAGVNDHD